MTPDAVLDIIDGAIERPMTVQEAVAFLEDVQEGLRSRLEGLAEDLKTEILRELEQGE